MARLATKKENKWIELQTALDAGKKLLQQQAEKKIFINTGAGVVPEDVWESLKVKK